jgi:hypothetical protein
MAGSSLTVTRVPNFGIFFKEDKADGTRVFVPLEPMPSDFRSAFPLGVEVKRASLCWRWRMDYMTGL